MRDAKPDRLIKVLESEGFVQKSNNKHLKMVKGTITVPVKTHGIIKRNTVEAIRKMSGIDKATFYSYKF